jgi:hypothetical protein
MRPCPARLLIGEGRDLLLLDLVVGEVLLVLLPALARCGGHVCASGGGGGESVSVWRAVCGGGMFGRRRGRLMAERGRERVAGEGGCW